MNRAALPLLAFAALLTGGISIYRSHPWRERTDPSSPPPAAQFPRAVAASGLVEPSSETIAIGTPVAGVVERVWVQPGQAVRAGDPIFKTDDRHFLAALSARKAAVFAATARKRTAVTVLADAEDRLARSEKLGAARTVSEDEVVRHRFARNAAEARLGEARAEIAAAEARVRETETEIERCTVRAPIDADVLQVKIRPGEFAPAGQSAESLVALGRIRPQHVRVEVDEIEGWRVHPEAPAVAHLRGNSRLRVPLKFVRFEPLVVPKRSLTGTGTERVDTRVLQVIYAVAGEGVPFRPGQQVDVFIEEKENPPARSGHATGQPE